LLQYLFGIDVTTRRLGRAAGERANRNKVLVAYFANVVHSERQQCLRPAGGGDELNLESVRLVDLDDRSEVPSAQALLR
jgi:hypothetical protein